MRIGMYGQHMWSSVFGGGKTLEALWASPKTKKKMYRIKTMLNPITTRSNCKYFIEPSFRGKISIVNLLRVYVRVFKYIHVIYRHNNNVFHNI